MKLCVLNGGGEETPAPLRPLSLSLYEFPIGLKEIDFGKQTTNYKLNMVPVLLNRIQKGAFCMRRLQLKEYSAE